MTEQLPLSYRRFTEGWQPPAPEEVRAFLTTHNLTGASAAELVGVRDARTVRKWCAPADASNHSPIPYAAWRLLLLATGAVAEP